MKINYMVITLMAYSISWTSSANLTYPIVDTGQTECFDIKQASSTCPTSSADTFGQDAQYVGNHPTYQANIDGTVTDKMTGLIWSSTTDINNDGKINANDKLSYQEAIEYVDKLRLAGYDDWRLPSIKELYSLILFDGQDPSGFRQSGTVHLIPFIDHQYFAMNSGDTESGERLIDSQFVSSTKYVSTTMRGDETVFGVNFIDGRIKGYGIENPRGGQKTFYVLAVRGNKMYGQNQFSDNTNGTIEDTATGLLWQQSDSRKNIKFPEALSYCQNLSLAGRSDWRLPNIKELQSIVDYSRSPNTSNSGAIDPIFEATMISNEAGQADYANYWSSTTHQNLRNGANAAYIAFGRSMGYMNNQWIDVHGAGSQRSDPKSGSTNMYPTGHGPQGDAVRVENMVRCVSGGNVEFVQSPIQSQRSAKAFINKEQSTSSMKAKHMNTMPITTGRLPPRMDRNGDGKLSRNEVKGKLAQDFSRLDSNNDGYLTPDEIPPKR
ncbi:Lcl domain-containing protein [Vibrio sp. T11.5]|uniref:Lcl domain-containing protein n=1 Tax=Vibrio sp. T11.5 TaxID=2998836 RepID=UPI0022CD8999|nr:DUF1566 domain-containing protein [Vibrio sp. T11.5]MDA0118152.1 DUF1566 domain-containing protein [Vibrio sp. T11.5]